MTEFWVSQAKYYCKFCNTWMADNKPSKQNHENSIKHKIAVDLFQKEKREKALHGTRSERELKQQLEEIDKLAKEAMQIDKISNSGQFYQSTSRLNTFHPPPPPPPPVHSTGLHSSSSSSSSGYSSTSNVKNEEQSTLTKDLREDSSGVYEIRGQTYLEGIVHQDRLRQGVECEIFIEAEDIWLPGIVTKRREIAIPNTSLTLKSFDIKYTRHTGVISSKVSNDDGSSNMADDTHKGILTSTTSSSDDDQIIGVVSSTTKCNDDDQVNGVVSSTTKSNDDDQVNGVVSSTTSSSDDDQTIGAASSTSKSNDDDKTMTIMVETEVKADRLRMLVSKEEAEQYVLELQSSSSSSSDGHDITSTSCSSSSGSGSSSSSSSSKPKGLLSMDANRGYGGGWQTVSVEVTDDAEALRLEAIRVQEAEEAKIIDASSRKRNIDMARLAASAAENIMESVDPYHTGMYKGRYVGGGDSSDRGGGRSSDALTQHQSSIQAQELEASLSLSKGASVSFKKRKRLIGDTTTTTTTNITTSTTTSTSGSTGSSNSNITNQPTTTSDTSTTNNTSTTIQHNKLDDNKDASMSGGILESKYDDDDDDDGDDVITNTPTPTPKPSITFKKIKNPKIVKPKDFISYED